MVDTFRTLLAKFLVKHFIRARRLIVQAWFWPPAESVDTEEKRRCLNAVLQIDPDNEPASLALLVLDQTRPES